MHHLIIFISSDNIDYKLSLKVIQLKQQTKEDYWYCCLLTLDICRSINTTRGNAITSFIMAKPTSRVCLFLLAYSIYTPRKNNWSQYFMQRTGAYKTAYRPIFRFAEEMHNSMQNFTGNLFLSFWNIFDCYWMALPSSYSTSFFSTIYLRTHS